MLNIVYYCQSNIPVGTQGSQCSHIRVDHSLTGHPGPVAHRTVKTGKNYGKFQGFCPPRLARAYDRMAVGRRVRGYLGLSERYLQKMVSKFHDNGVEVPHKQKFCRGTGLGMVSEGWSEVKE